MTRTILIAALAIVTLLPAGAASATTPKAAWVSQCVGELSKDNKDRANRRYCACMYEMIGEAEDKYEYALERRWPPVHRHCYKKAGFKPPR
jgi:hypothetical protein